MIMSTRDFLKQQDAEEAFNELKDDIEKRSQRGPHLEGRYHQETLTDFVVFMNGRAWWIEVKTKTQKYSWDGNVVHGVDKHHFESYGRLEKIVGAPVHIAFVCKESNAVLKAPYASLKEGAVDGGWFKKKADGKWCRLMHCRFDRLKKWFSLNSEWYSAPAQHYKRLSAVAPPQPPIPVLYDRHGQLSLF